MCMCVDVRESEDVRVRVEDEGVGCDGVLDVRV